MRRLPRILLWLVKGLLLLIALAALVLWPVSRGRWMSVRVQRWTAGPASGELRWYTAACHDGRAVLRLGWQYAWDQPGLASIAPEQEPGGDGWRWKGESGASDWREGDWPARRGPLRWRYQDYNGPDMRYRYRFVALPLWLVALAAGAWPLASIGLALRRRAKRRRAAREGLCKHCGYDLRATPAAGGALLAVCPECGKETKIQDGD